MLIKIQMIINLLLLGYLWFLIFHEHLIILVFILILLSIILYNLLLTYFILLFKVLLLNHMKELFFAGLNHICILSQLLKDFFLVCVDFEINCILIVVDLLTLLDLLYLNQICLNFYISVIFIIFLPWRTRIVRAQYLVI